MTADTSRVLVARHIDPWLLGGLGIALWVLLSIGDWGGPTIPAVADGPLYWLMIAASATHFGASYHLAYGQGRETVKRHWLALVVVPAALLLVSIGLAGAALTGSDVIVDEGVRFLLASVYTLTGWHYVKQVYGVARLAAGMNRLSLSRHAVTMLRFGLYPLWLVEAARVWTGRSSSSFNFATSYALLPAALIDVIRWIVYGTIAGFAVLLVMLVGQWKRLPPATLWTPYAVAFLWFLAPPSHGSTVLVFAALHGLQYLACVHRAELAWGAERGAESMSWWWVSAFGGALATGMLLAHWLPRMLTDEAGSLVGTAPAALLFVLFNLHHYAVDMTIWRSGGEHIRRIAKGPSVTSSAPPPLVTSTA